MLSTTLEPESAYSAFNLNLVSELAPLHHGAWRREVLRGRDQGGARRRARGAVHHALVSHSGSQSVGQSVKWV